MLVEVRAFSCVDYGLTDPTAVLEVADAWADSLVTLVVRDSAAYPFHPKLDTASVPPAWVTPV